MDKQLVTALDRHFGALSLQRESLLAEIELEQREFDERMRARRRDLARLEEAMAAAKALLSFETGQPPTEPMVRRNGSTQSTSPGDGIADAVFEILREHDSPMHYTELLPEVIRRGHIVAGKRPSATLLSRIVTDPRFVRPRRGTYTLAEKAPGTRSVGKRRAPSARAKRR